MFTYSYLLLCCLVCAVTAQDKPIDIVNAEEYEGTYLATQPGVLVMPSSKLFSISTDEKVESSPSSTDSPIAKP